MQFFISHLASWLRTRRFSEPTFRPSGAPNHWKNTVNRDFPIFSRICIFFLLIFSLLTLFTSAFQLSILSEVSLLNFLRSYFIFFIIEREHSDLAGIDRDYPGFVTPDRCALLIYDMAPLCAHCCFLGILMATHVAPEYAHVCSVHLIPRLLAFYGILRADRGEKQSSFHALQAL